MGLTTSLYTGLSGLNASSQLISVTGNNIANVNTSGFKASRVDFQTQISDTMSGGSAPSGELGGANPMQVGLGVGIGSVTRNFADGALQPTGKNTDLAIEGDGFFMVKVGDLTKFTRAGNFKLDSNFNLTSDNGGIVQGYDIDNDFNILAGATQPLVIPLGSLTLAEATRGINFAGNLNANGASALNGAVVTSDVLYADAGQATPASDTTALTSLYSGTGTQLFVDGDVVTFSGATRGGSTLPDATFQVGAADTTGSDGFGTTLADYMTFLQGVLGIDTSVPLTTAGVTCVAGAIRVEGNTGIANDLGLDNSDIINNKGSLSPITPFAFTKSQSADGESVKTTFIGYDSLGTTMTFDLNVVLETKNSSGTTWRFYAQSGDDSDVSRVLGNGTLSFDTNGQFVSATGQQITIDRARTGAVTPQTITLNFEKPSGALSALTDVTSQISAVKQDGTAIGVLKDFSVESDGKVVGIFSNSETRNLGQVVLAKFANPAGLIESGGSMYTATPASGDASITIAGAGGAGSIVGGAIELSNVDLSQEFINLISASTGFSANSRVLSTSDRLIQELIQSIR